MVHPLGESKNGPLRVDFDLRLKLELYGSKVTSDGGDPYDQSNLQPLCGSCHTKKTHRHRVARHQG